MSKETKSCDNCGNKKHQVFGEAFCCEGCSVLQGNVFVYPCWTPIKEQAPTETKMICSKCGQMINAEERISETNKTYPECIPNCPECFGMAKKMVKLEEEVRNLQHAKDNGIYKIADSKLQTKIQKLEAVVSSQAKEIDGLKADKVILLKSPDMSRDKGLELRLEWQIKKCFTLNEQISDLQQRLDTSSEKLKEAVEIITKITSIEWTGTGSKTPYGETTFTKQWKELDTIFRQAEKFLEANPLNTSQVEGKEPKEGK